VLAEVGFASGHLSGVSLVVFTGQVKQTVEEEDFNFDLEGMGEVGGLAGGGVEREAEVGHAGPTYANPPRGQTGATSACDRHEVHIG